MKCAIETVTPKMASQILEKNTNNRRVSESIVKQYAAAMSRGEWKLNGESIKISNSGALLDGQHRLTAVAQSGVVVEMLVIRDVEPTTIDTIDVGKRRQFHDWLSMQGESHPILLASSLTVLFMYRNYYEIGDRILKATPTFQQLEDLLHASPSLRHSAAVANSAYQDLKRVFNPSLLCVTHYLFSRISEEKTTEFFDKLVSGADLSADSPILALRTTGFRWATYSHKPPAYEMLACFIQAWNAFILDKSLHRCGYVANAKLPQLRKV